MSLVGTRPPTVDEWDKYELHHRARLATKPGLTGMWQVSGRSNITDFEEVVKLDKQYISEWTMGLDIKILCNTIVVPIYVDIDKRKKLVFSSDEEYVNLIYPGNPYKKDDFESMVGSLMCLSEGERKRIKLHLTGASLASYKASAPGCEDIIDKYIEQGVIIYHSWMEYTE